VVDLCGFDTLDSQALVDAAQRAGRTDLPLIACSSLAERPWSHWNQPESADSPLADDAYGRNKRLYSQALIDRWPGPCLALLLPNLLEISPLDPRLRQWWQQARASGVAVVPGDGSQKAALLTSDLAADLITLLGGHPTPLRGRLALALPQPPAVLELARALFAAVDPPLLLKTGGPQGVFSAGPEPVNLQRQADLLPAYPWPDLLGLMRQLGQRLAIAAVD
jgi:nucleoside-diphosphate-sugar epimerase